MKNTLLFANKICKACGVEKALTDFYVNMACKDKHANTCKCCVRTRNNALYKRKVVVLAARVVSVVAKRCAKCGEIKRQEHFNLRTQSKDGLEVYCRLCQSNIKKTAYSAAYEAIKRRKRQEKDPITLRLRQMVASAKRRAKEQNVPFDLDLSFMRTLALAVCPALCIHLDYKARRTAYNSPTLDKFYPALGYVKNNVTIISYRANSMKNDGSYDDLFSVLMWMQQKMNRSSS